MPKSIEIISLSRKAPANDNAGTPPVIPVFASLLARHDLTHFDVLVYGAVHAFESGPAPGIARLASVLGVHPRSVINSLRRLRERDLVHRAHRGHRSACSRYVALGPRSAA